MIRTLLGYLAWNRSSPLVCNCFLQVLLIITETLIISVIAFHPKFWGEKKAVIKCKLKASSWGNLQSLDYFLLKFDLWIVIIIIWNCFSFKEPLENFLINLMKLFNFVEFIYIPRVSEIIHHSKWFLIVLKYWKQFLEQCCYLKKLLHVVIIINSLINERVRWIIENTPRTGCCLVSGFFLTELLSLVTSLILKIKWTTEVIQLAYGLDFVYHGQEGIYQNSKNEPVAVWRNVWLMSSVSWKLLNILIICPCCCKVTDTSEFPGMYRKVFQS